MPFEWDERKNQANIAKHGYDFRDAATGLLRDHITRPSPSPQEERYVAIGPLGDKIVTVVYTVRAGNIRIISARRARKNEERAHRALQCR